MAKQLYMVVRDTNIEESKILYVAPLNEATLLGQVYMCEHPGQHCSAPPLEGRGFSKFDLKMLQYIFWNTFSLVPSDDYATLVKMCITEAEKMQLTDVNIGALEATLTGYGFTGTIGSVETVKPPKEPKQKREPREPRQPKDPSTPKQEVDRPRTGSTTALVWEILDKYNVEGIDLKELRNKAFNEFVTQEGQSASTFSVQFSKWKAKNVLTDNK